MPLGKTFLCGCHGNNGVVKGKDRTRASGSDTMSGPCGCSIKSVSMNARYFLFRIDCAYVNKASLINMSGSE